MYFRASAQERKGNQFAIKQQSGLDNIGSVDMVHEKIVYVGGQNSKTTRRDMVA